MLGTDRQVVYTCSFTSIVHIADKKCYKPLSKILPNIGPPFPTSCVGQFHRLLRNWNLHSSMAIRAPFCKADIVPGCFVTSFLCFFVNGKRLGLLYSCVLDLRSFDGFPMLASVLKATQFILKLFHIIRTFVHY